MYVKICGLKTSDDVRVAIAAGADAIGLVLSQTSPRAVSQEQALKLVTEVKELSDSVDTVLVVHDLSISEVVAAGRKIGVDVVQLHGYSEADTRHAVAEMGRVWRATSASSGPLKTGAYGEEALLLDSSTPGSGSRWDLNMLSEAPSGQWMLAGGLDPDNVAEAIQAVHPWGVDVSSGVESVRGTKDHNRIRDFVAAVRAVQS